MLPHVFEKTTHNPCIQVLYSRTVLTAARRCNFNTPPPPERHWRIVRISYDTLMKIIITFPCVQNPLFCLFLILTGRVIIRTKSHARRQKDQTVRPFCSYVLYLKILFMYSNIASYSNTPWLPTLVVDPHLTEPNIEDCRESGYVFVVRIKYAGWSDAFVDDGWCWRGQWVL